MNAVGFRLKVAATDESEFLQQPITIRHQTVEREAALRQLRVPRRRAAEAADLRCPHCDSIIYSRRNKLCGLCARALPLEFLFSASEADRLENILRMGQERHRRWMRKNGVGVFYV